MEGIYNNRRIIRANKGYELCAILKLELCVLVACVI